MKPLFFILIGLLSSCSEAQMKESVKIKHPFTFLALGDSYTIGESVAEQDSWPFQLNQRLRKAGIDISDPRIIATTGWTTDELQAAIKREQPSSDFDLVSLLIGVNNQYRGYPIAQYESEFMELLNQSIALANGKQENVFVISIPDYGVTPFTKGLSMSADKIARDLNAYNDIAKLICDSKEVQFFDITEWSRNAATDASLIAEDELHPSGKMYKNWVDTYFEWVLSNLQAR